MIGFLCQIAKQSIWNRVWEQNKDNKQRTTQNQNQIPWQETTAPCHMMEKNATLVDQDMKFSSA